MSWSKTYYEGLTEYEHEVNDKWFKDTIYLLKEDGVLHVPNLNKTFNKQGEEIQCHS